MMKWFGQKRPQSVLGLSLDNGRLCASVVHKAKGSVEESQALSVGLALGLSHKELPLVGQELRNHLDEAKIRERHCIVSLPPSWVMTIQTLLPADLTPVESFEFLQMEAERNFACPPEQLQVVQSTAVSREGSYVTQLGVRREELDRLSTVLKTANLKPVAYTLGLVSLPHVVGPEDRGSITLHVEGTGATMIATVGTGIIALRHFESTYESEKGELVLNTATVARECRITLEQIPTALRTELSVLRLVGDSVLANQLTQNLANWASASSLRLEDQSLSDSRTASLLVKQLGVRFLTEAQPELNLLPPKPKAFEVFMARYGTKKLTTAGIAGATLVLLLALSFVGQMFYHWSLETEWTGMKLQVTSLEKVQGSIRDYRAWYDVSFRNLTIFKKVTEAFPDNGNVTAKTFEVRGVSNVIVTGTTRDNTALMKTFEQLRKLPEVSDCKVEQIRGKSPAQFTISFRWHSTPGS